MPLPLPVRTVRATLRRGVRAVRRGARGALAVAALVVAAALPATTTRAADTALADTPLLPSGPDPWVIADGGWFYYTHTLGDRVAIWKTKDLRTLAQVQPVVAWRKHADGSASTSVWAPELHKLRGRWYLYFTAADKAHDDDAHRHLFVLENVAADPTQGHWVEKGMLATDHTGIDATVFEHRGALYLVYSAYVDNHSDLVIARMRDPWTLQGPQVDIAAPTFDWEKQDGRQILEAPEFLEGPDGKVFLSYSASACWSDGYALGLLGADGAADLLAPSSWTKQPAPWLATAPAHQRYAPGHNAFFKSLDGREDWIIYHANGGPDWKCTAKRAPRMARVRFGADGMPAVAE